MFSQLNKISNILQRSGVMVNDLSLDSNNRPIINSLLNNMTLTPVNMPQYGYDPGKKQEGNIRNFTNSAYINSLNRGYFLDSDGNKVPYDQLSEIDFGPTGFLDRGPEGKGLVYQKPGTYEGTPNLGLEGFRNRENSAYLYPGVDPETGEPIMKATRFGSEGEEDIKTLNNYGLDIYNVFGLGVQDRSMLGNFGYGALRDLSQMVTGPIDVMNTIRNLGRGVGSIFTGEELKEGNLDKWGEEWRNYWDRSAIGPTSQSIEAGLESPFMEDLGGAASSMAQFLLPYAGITKTAKLLGIGEKLAYELGFWGSGALMNVPEAYESASLNNIPVGDRALISATYGFVATALEKGIGANKLAKFFLKGQGSEKIAQAIASEVGAGIPISQVSNKAMGNIVSKAFKSFDDFTKIWGPGQMVEEGTEEVLQYATLNGIQTLYDNVFAEKDAEIGSGKFGAYWNDKAFKEMFYEGLLGGLVGGVTGAGMGTKQYLERRKLGENAKTLAYAVATNSEEEVYKSLEMLKGSKQLDDSQYTKAKGLIDYFVSIKKDNPYLFNSFIGTPNYKEKVADAITTINNIDAYIDYKKNKPLRDQERAKKQKEYEEAVGRGENPDPIKTDDAVEDLIGPPNEDRVIRDAYKAGISNYIKEKFATELGITDKGYFEEYDTISKKIKSRYKNPAQRIFYPKIFDGYFAYLDGSIAQANIESDIKKETSKTGLQSRELSYIEKKALQETTNEELAKIEKDKETKNIFEEKVTKEVKDKLEKTKKDLDQEIAELETVDPKLKDLLGFEHNKLISNLFKQHGNITNKLNTLDATFNFFDKNNNVEKYIQELQKKNTEELQKEQEEAQKTAKKKETVKNKPKRNDPSKRKVNPNTFDLDDSGLGDIKKAFQIRANPSNYSKKEVEWAQDILSKADVGDEHEYLLGPIYTIGDKEGDSVDDSIGKILDEINEKKGSTSNKKITVTSLAYLHNRYLTVKEGKNTFEKTVIDPTTGRISQVPNADRRFSLPNTYLPGTKLILFVDKGYVNPENPSINYNTLKDNLATIPIAIQEVSKYGKEAPTAYLHTLSWIGKIDNNNNLISPEGDYISDRVAKPFIGKVFAETKAIRETLFKDINSTYETEVVSKNNGTPNFSKRETNITELLKRDSRVFAAIGLLGRLEAHPSKVGLISDDLNWSAKKGILYLMYPNAAGSYNFTRVRQTQLEKTPDKLEKYTDIVNELIFDYLGEKKYSKSLMELRTNIDRFVYTSSKTLTSKYSDHLTELEKQARNIRKGLIFHVFEGMDGTLFLNLPHPTKTFAVYRTKKVVNEAGKEEVKLFATEYEDEESATLVDTTEMTKPLMRNIIRDSIRKKYPNIQGEIVLEPEKEITTFDLDENKTLKPRQIKYIDFFSENNLGTTNLEPIEVAGTWTYTSQPLIAFNPKIYPSGQTRPTEERDWNDPDVISGEAFEKTWFGDKFDEALGDVPDITGDTDLISKPKSNIINLREEQGTNDPELLSIVTDNLERLNIASFNLLKDTTIEDQLIKNLTEIYIDLEKVYPIRDRESRRDYQRRLLEATQVRVSEIIAEYRSISEKEESKEKQAKYSRIIGNLNHLLSHFEPQLNPNGRIFVGYGNRILGEIESLDFDLYENEDATEENTSLLMTNNAEDWNLKKDPETSASARVRRFLYTLKISSGEKSPINMPILRDYAQTFNMLLTQLSDFPMEDLDQVLQELAQTELEEIEKGSEAFGIRTTASPILYEVWKGLQERSAVDPSFKNEFFRVVHKHTNLMETLLTESAKKDTKYPIYRVGDSNTRGSIGMVVESWRNKFYEKGRSSGLIISDPIAKSLRVDKIKAKEFLNLFNTLGSSASNMTQFVDYMSQFFTEILGIDLPVSVIKAISRDWQSKGPFYRRFFKDIPSNSFRGFFKAAFGPVVESLTNESQEENIYRENNPFYKQSDVISILARYYLRAFPDTYATSFKDAHNNTRYGFVETNNAASKFQKFTSGNQAFIDRKLGNAFSRRSTWLSIITDTATEKRNKVQFKYALFDASKNIKNYEGAFSYHEMSEREREVTRLNLFINSNKVNSKFLWITPSDKQNIPLITAPRFRLYEKTLPEMFSEGKVDLGKDVLLVEQLFDLLVMSEVDRINGVVKAFNDVSLEERPKRLRKGYHFYGDKLGAGAYFHLIPELNNLIEVDPKFGISDFTEYESAKIKDFLIDHFINLVEDRVSTWDRVNLVNFKTGDAQIDYHAMVRALEKVASDNNKFRNAINYVATDYVVNYAIAMANISMLFSGDPALYYKIPKNWKGDWQSLNISTMANLFKRTAKDIAPGMEGHWESDNNRVNYVFFNAGEVSSETGKYSEKLASYMGTNYENIDHTDGQEWVIAEEYINNLLAFGYIKKKVRDEILEKLKSGQNLNPFELKHLLNPQKPVYVGEELWRYTSDKDPSLTGEYEEIYYIKPSSLPLIPQLTRKFPKLDALRLEMERDTNKDGSERPKVHRLVSSSTIKTGITKSIDIFEKDGSLKSDINIDADNIISLSRSGLRIQQEVPNKPFKKKSTRGAQYSTLQYGDLEPSWKFNLGKHSLGGEKLFHLDGKITSELYRRRLEKLIRQLGVTPVTIEKDGKDFTIYEPTDLTKIKNMLIHEAITRKGWAYNDLLFLNILDDVFTPGQSFQIPLFFHPAINKIEALLNSLISNRVLKRELPGKTYVQGSPAGFEGATTMSLEYALDEYREDVIFTSDYNPNKRLGYGEDEKGVYAEVLMPFIFKDNKGNPLNIRDYIDPITGLLDAKKIDPELLNIIGYRIPTQGFNSMLRLKVVGFLPPSSSDLIIVPAEWLRQTGSDFDIDKIFTHNYNYNYDSIDGNITKLQNTIFTRSEGLDASLEETPDVELENALIDLTFSIFSHPEINKKQVIPLDNNDIADVIEELDKVVTKEVKSAPSVINITTQEEAIEMGAAGQLGIAIASLFSVGHVNRQYANAYIGRVYDSTGAEVSHIPILFLDDNKQLYKDSRWGEDYISNRTTPLTQLAIENATKGISTQEDNPYSSSNAEGAWRLDKIYGFNRDKKGKRKLISDVIKNIQNASVDNASKPQLHHLYLNAETFDVGLLIASVGFDERFIGFFLRQPIIKEYVNRKLDSQGFIKSSFEEGTAEDFELQVYEEAGLHKLDMSVTAFSLDDLKNSLRNGNADKLIRAQILYNFIAWKELARAVNDTQTAFNTATKLLDKSIYSTILKKEQVRASSRQASPIKNIDRLKKLDTTTGGAYEYGVKIGSLLFNSDKLIPFNSVVLGNNGILGELSRQLGITGEMNEELVNRIMTDLRSATYTAVINVIFANDPDFSKKSLNEIRKELLFGEGSLAKRLMRAQAFLKNDFVRILRPKIAEEFEEPDTVEFSASRGMRDSDVARLQGAWLSLFKRDPNSEEYKLGRDLLVYAWINGNERNAKDFGRFVPADVYSLLGADQALHNVSFRDTKGGIGSLILENFPRQWFQHNPFRAKQVRSDDFREYSTADGKNYSSSNPIARFTLKSPYDPNSKTERFLVQASNGPGKILTDYLFIFDKLSERVHLYEKNIRNDFDNTIEYLLIPTLGFKPALIKEYDLHEAKQTSVIGESLNTLIQRKIREKTHLKRVSEGLSTNLSPSLKEKVFRGGDIAISHSFDQGPIATLESIAKNGSTPEFKAMATYFLSRKGRLTGWNNNPYSIDNADHWSNYDLHPEWDATRKMVEEKKRSGEMKGRTINRKKLILVNYETINSKIDFEKTFLHEITHANINYIIDNEKYLTDNSPERAALNSTRAIIKLLRDNEGYIEKLKKRDDEESFQILYALGLAKGNEFSGGSAKALTEFFAALTTNRTFQLDLNEIEYNKTSIVKRIWNIITSLLGFSPRKNYALSAAMQNLLDLTENENLVQELSNQKAAATTIPLPSTIEEDYAKFWGASTEGSELISQPLSNIETIIDRKYQIKKILYNKLSQKGANREEIGARIERVTLQIKRLEASGKVLELENSLAQDVNDIKSILRKVNTKLSENTITLPDASYIWDSLVNVGYYIDVWNNLLELIHYQDKASQKVIDDFYIDLRKAEEKKIELMKKAAILTANNFAWRKNFTENELFEGVRDEGPATLNFLGAHHSDTKLVQIADDMINSMTHVINQKFYYKKSEIETKVREVVRNTGLTEDQIYDKLSQKYSNGQKTGNLVYRYKQEYWDTKQELAKKAKSGEGSWSEYWKFVHENTKTITDKMIKGEEQGFWTDEEFEKQKQNWQRYQEELKAVKEVLLATYTDEFGNYMNKSAQKHLEYALLLWEKRNSPIEYMRHIRGEGKGKLHPNNIGRNYVVGDVPKDIWLDPRYKEIENNPKLKEFYDFVYDTFKYNNDLLPYKKGNAPNRIPELEKGFVENVKDVNMLSAVGGLAEDIKEAFWSQPENLWKRSATIGGKDIKFIPTPMQSNRLTPDQKSYNIKILLIAHTALAIGYEHKTQMEPIVNGMSDLLGTMKAGEAVKLGNKYISRLNRSGTVETNKSLENSRAHLEGVIDAIFYNNFKNKNELFKKYTKEERERVLELEELIESTTNIDDKIKYIKELGSLGKAFNGNTAIDALNKYTYSLGLGFPNIASPITNTFYGIISNFVYAAGSEYVTEANLMKGIITMMGAVSRKAVDALDKKNLLKVYGFMDSMGLLTHLVESSDRSEVDKVVSALVLFQTKAEYINQGSLLIGILKTFEMRDKNNNIVSIWDAYTVDKNNALVWNEELMGEKEEADASEIVSQDRKRLNFYRLGKLIENEIGIAHGDYESIMIGKKKGWFRLLMLYKTWLPESVHHRFGNIWENPRTGKVEKGRYRSYFESLDQEGGVISTSEKLMEMAKAMLKLSQKGSFKNFSALDRTNMARNARELQFILLLTAIIIMLQMAVDDDKKDPNKSKKYALNALINLINRARIDIQFYTNPNSFLTLLGSPIAAVGTLANGFKVASVALDTIQGDGILQTGPFKGWPKLGKWALGMLPGGYGYIRMENLGAKVHNALY